MTAHELKQKLAKEFGFGQWPQTYEVDAETYGYVCQAVLDNCLQHQFPEIDVFFRYKVAVGPNNGLMFQNVELLLKAKEE